MALARVAVAAGALSLTLLGASHVAAQDMPAPPVAPAAPAPPTVPPTPPQPLTVVEGQAIEQALRDAPEYGSAGQLDGAAEALASPDPNVRAAAGAALSRAAIALARVARGRLVDPASIDPNWALRGPYDAAAEFAKARDQGAVAAWLQGLAPRNPTYLALLAARNRYAAIVGRGGWPSLPAGLVLKPGSRGAEVARLRARLDAEGYADDEPGLPVYDRALAAEVAEFQSRHALKATGVLTRQTTAAMNVPAAARVATLSANLERERWLPAPMPPARVVADIPAAEVTLFENGQPALTMRAIVGEPTKPTPMFASHISSIEFNPAWHVPMDIAKAELWPKEARSPGYLKAHDYSVVNGQLVQQAGPKSALGRVKFEIPNQFAVYLHDTPGRALFAVDSRGRSHGCVRLQKPNDLAVALLSNQGWTLEKVKEVIAKGDTRWVRPKTTMPVFLVYRTAEAPDGGPAIFRPDLYGWDGRVNAALAAAPR
ncbi:MAG: L,D-transpeptidase family protein [Caulobacteraceae bacterium]